ncbi:MAG: ion transporter [Eubacteriales bacterium]|nr:ion transporter [Eubacteriales bacterium]
MGENTTKCKQKKPIRLRLYEIIEKDRNQDMLSKLYDRYVLLLVVLSAIPLVFKLWDRRIFLLDRTVTCLFIVDYILRWLTADYMPRLKKYPKWKAFLLYPFTPMAIIDLLSILPALTTFAMLPTMTLPNFLRVVRLMRVFRCIRFFKTMRYAKSMLYLYRAVQRERKLLIAVLLIAVVYVFVSAAMIFSVEPDTFGSFFDALYWATATLTTVGYGDIHPVSQVGRAVSMVSAIFGIAVVAMPSSIITAGFLEEVNRERFKDERKLEEEVSDLLDEIKALRREQAERGLEEKIAQIDRQMRTMQEKNDDDAALLQDLSEDLKNALSRGTMTEEKHDQ